MPRKRRRERGRLGALTPEQEMDLMIGPSHRRPDYVDDAARAAAWFEHREALLAEAPAGQRPSAWWRYESGLNPGERPSTRDAIAWLRTEGLLTPFEEAELAKWSKLRETGFAIEMDRDPAS